MSLELVPTFGRTFTCCCGHDQFVVTFGGTHSPLITCQNCGQSYGLSGSSAAPFRMVGDTDAFIAWRSTATIPKRNQEG